MIVLSSDQAVRVQVAAAVASRPGARAVYLAAEGVAHWRPAVADRVVVIDDEGLAGAEALVREVKARNTETRIVYLAAEHSHGLELEARQAGATWYAVKPAPGRDLERVIQTLLRT